MEKRNQVSLSANLTVDKVFTIPLSIQTTSHGHFIVFNFRENAVGVVEDKTYLAGVHGLSIHRTAEDNVLHAAATQVLCRFFTKHPTYRIGNITLAAPVRAYDTGNAGVKADYRFVGKGLKADKLYFF